jgi:hypothetical protein
LAQKREELVKDIPKVEDQVPLKVKEPVRLKFEEPVVVPKVEKPDAL